MNILRLRWELVERGMSFAKEARYICPSFMTLWSHLSFEERTKLNNTCRVIMQTGHYRSISKGADRRGSYSLFSLNQLENRLTKGWIGSELLCSLLSYFDSHMAGYWKPKEGNWMSDKKVYLIIFIHKYWRINMYTYHGFRPFDISLRLKPSGEYIAGIHMEKIL